MRTGPPTLEMSIETRRTGAACAAGATLSTRAIAAARRARIAGLLAEGSAAVQTYVFGAGTGNDTNGLKFLSSAHLTVTVDGISVAFSVPAGHASFTITGATIVGGEDILVERGGVGGFSGHVRISG